MNKLKSIFSPRKLILVIVIVLSILTIPEFTSPSLSQTNAIITMVSLDKVDGEIQIAAKVLTPTDDKKSNYEIYSSTGKTLGQAVEKLSILIGKQIGFAQCDIVAFGDNIIEDGIMDDLDYLVRSKRAGRNALLISFSGDATEFSQIISDLTTKKSLSLDQIMDFNNRYLLIKKSNIETFYKDYFEDISIGYMPHLQIASKQDNNVIEVQASDSSSSGGSSGGQSSSGEDKKYLINDGSTSIFKKGKKIMELSPDMVRTMNLFVNKNQTSTFVVKNVTDDKLNEADVVVEMLDKITNLTPSFDKDNNPVFEVEMEIQVLIEQIIEHKPNDKYLNLDKDFLSKTVVNKLKEQVSNDMYSFVDFCKENKIDLVNAYSNFYHLKYKKFKKYLEKTDKENFLDGIKFKIDVKINSDY